jgi:hypothetical protein
MTKRLRSGHSFVQGLLLLLADLVLAGAVAAIAAHLAFVAVTYFGAPYFPENPHPSVAQLRSVLETGQLIALTYLTPQWIAVPLALVVVAGARLLGLTFRLFLGLVIGAFAIVGLVIVGMGMGCCGDNFSTLNLSFAAFLASGAAFGLVSWYAARCIDWLAHIE